jgi:hypothetical protein
MVVEIKRYLGNRLSAHIHDADHEHPNCHLGQIFLAFGQKRPQTFVISARRF